MPKFLTMDQMKEVNAAANLFQDAWDALGRNPNGRHELLRRFNRLPTEWEDTFVKFLRPDTVEQLRRMA